MPRSERANAWPDAWSLSRLVSCRESLPVFFFSGGTYVRRVRSTQERDAKTVFECHERAEKHHTHSVRVRLRVTFVAATMQLVHYEQQRRGHKKRSIFAPFPRLCLATKGPSSPCGSSATPES